MNPIVRKMEQRDITETVRLFSAVIDELHSGDNIKTRQAYKQRYTPARLTELLKHKERVYWVIDLDGKIVGFLLGMKTNGVGYIHWFGMDRKYRGKSLGKSMMNHALKDFEAKGCYKIDVFTYAEQVKLYNFFSSFDFKKVVDIEKNLFKIKLIYMTKKLADIPAEQMTKRIFIVGRAGQGVKLMGQVLANILAQLNKEVSLNVVYGSSVRAGLVRAELIYSELPVEVTFIEEADILVQLTKAKPLVVANECIVEADALCEEKLPCKKPCFLIPFEKVAAEKFGSSLFVNMLALGKLLELIGINIEKVNFAETDIPLKFLEKNVEAISYGYTYRDHVV